MKKYLLLIFVLLFPYVPMALMISRVPFKMLLVMSAIMFLLTLSASIISLICAIHKKWQSEKLALANMIIKLVHIPAYLLMFLIGAGGIMLIQFLAITIFVFLYDCVIIALSGLVAVSATISARIERKIDTGYMVFLCVTSFVFCIDVISSVVLYVKIKKANRNILQKNSVIE